MRPRTGSRNCSRITLPVSSGSPEFRPYLRGERFSVADTAGYVTCRWSGWHTDHYGRDFLLDAGVDWKSYVKPINARPAAQRVTADRNAYIAAARPA